MNAITFDEKDKSAEISVHELAQTMELGNSNGELSKNIPMQPGILLENMMEMTHRLSGYKPISRPIVIREQYCQADRKKVKENKPLELTDYLIKRFVTRIDLPLVEFKGTEHQFSPAIALTYAYTDNAKGMQVAFGESVHVCENLMAFGRYHFTTYGSQKIGFTEGMQLLEYWLQNLNPIHRAHVETVERLQNHMVSRNRYIELIGDLFQSSVRSNQGAGVFAPLNQTQVAAMVSNSSHLLANNDAEITAWDIMNAGTFVLKPHNSDMIELLEDTTSFNDFILKALEIPFEVPEMKMLN